MDKCRALLISNDLLLQCINISTEMTQIEWVLRVNFVPGNLTIAVTMRL